MKTQKNRSAEWIDIERPTAKDLEWLKKEYKLHPIIAEELQGPSARARVESYDGYLFFIYYFPKYDERDETSVRTEIDFIVTKKSVVTIHYEPISRVLQSYKIGEEKSSLELLHGIVEHLILFEERQMRHVREKVEQVAREIFKDNEYEMLQRISRLKRDISEYRIVVRLQEPILQSLRLKGRKFWGDESEIYLNDLAGDHMKVMNQLEDYREAIADFEDTNNQLMNLKISSVMKTFTLLSFLTFPFVLFVSLLALDAPDTPIVHSPNGFVVVVLIIAISMGILTLYFKKKHWF